MYVIINLYYQLLLIQGYNRVVLLSLMHILIVPLHILGRNGFGASERLSASWQLRPERTDQI